MKFLILGFIFLTSVTGQAEIYSWTSGIWHTPCYLNGVPSSQRASLHEDARK